VCSPRFPLPPASFKNHESLTSVALILIIPLLQAEIKPNILVDLLPTLAEIAGAEIPTIFQGDTEP
jgi:hypothetical protein